MLLYSSSNFHDQGMKDIYMRDFNKGEKNLKFDVVESSTSSDESECHTNMTNLSWKL